MTGSGSAQKRRHRSAERHHAKDFTMPTKQWIQIQRIACAESRRKGFRDLDTIDDLIQSVSLALLAEQERHPQLTLDDLVSRARCRTLESIKSHRRAERRQQLAIEGQTIITVRRNGGSMA